MRILVVGSGGREHALVWKLSQSSRVSQIIAAPGNPGIAEHARLADVAADDVDGLADLARREMVDLVVVGPETPLSLGLADRLAALDIACFGPTKAAARLESSKAFAKAFMERHTIPTADYAAFRDAGAAKAYIADRKGPYVVKASGLCAGKGVVICKTLEEANAEIDAMLSGKYGDASAEIVIEDFLQGEEASVFAVIGRDGRVSLLPPCQDHKRALDGDKGPNTGGMGAYGPTPKVDGLMMKRIADDVVAPTVRGMVKEGMPYLGVLYIGLILTAMGPKVVEFNCRFGDPEAQVLMRLEGGDFAHALSMAAGSGLPYGAFQTDPSARHAVCVVLASKGYPGVYETGAPIAGIEAAELTPGVKVFHAGTTRDKQGRLVSAGGRVLNVTATGPTLREAVQRAYAAVDLIQAPGLYHRKDIAWRALN